MSAPFYVVHHDCDADSEDYVVFGPFDSAEEATAFAERHALFIPSDGGYAFAAVIPPIDNEGVTPPSEWDAFLDDDGEVEVSQP